MPYLLVAAESNVEAVSTTARPLREQGPEWEEARREGCETPLELRLLKAIRSAGLQEPQKQYEIYNEHGRLITRADFAYLEPRRVLVYADGVSFR